MHSKTCRGSASQAVLVYGEDTGVALALGDELPLVVAWPLHPNPAVHRAMVSTNPAGDSYATGWIVDHLS